LAFTEGSVELRRIVLSSFGLVPLVVEEVLVPVDVEELPELVAGVLVPAFVVVVEPFPPLLDMSTITTTITTTITPSNAAPARREPVEVCGLRGPRGCAVGVPDAPDVEDAPEIPDALVADPLGPGPTPAAANREAVVSLGVAGLDLCACASRELPVAMALLASASSAACARSRTAFSGIPSSSATSA
jgi:hypothetical protein